MLEVIKALSQSSLPEILAFAGVLFIFLAIGGKFGAQIITDNIPKPIAACIGGILLLGSLALFVISTTIQYCLYILALFQSQEELKMVMQQTTIAKPPVNKPLEGICAAGCALGPGLCGLGCIW